MRTIDNYLFKGYSKEKRDWVFGSLIVTEDCKNTLIVSDVGCFAVEPNSVGEFTGLVDGESGVQIYEGDLLIDEKGNVYRVEFSNGAYMLYEYDGQFDYDEDGFVGGLDDETALKLTVWSTAFTESNKK